MTEIKLYKSKRKVFKLLLGLPFVFIGIWVISRETYGTFDYFMGWVCTIFFGLAIPLIIYNLLDNRPQIIINEEGIWDRTLKQDLIKWEQIINFRLLNIHNQIFISVKVDKTFVYKNKFYKLATKLNNLVGAENLNLNLGQINVDENKLLELINNLRTSEKHLRSEKIKKFENKT
jgi:hypothetical protein